VTPDRLRVRRALSAFEMGVFSGRVTTAAVVAAGWSSGEASGRTARGRRGRVVVVVVVVVIAVGRVLLLSLSWRGMGFAWGEDEG
jgi:hypothetical protein